jgi:NYN domain
MKAWPTESGTPSSRNNLNDGLSAIRRPSHLSRAVWRPQCPPPSGSGMARFSAQTARCLKCKTTWTRHEEKETDVHFSLTFLEDAIDNVFDRAIIVSADSDHVPAVRRVRARLPAKQIFAATPPGRHGHAREMLKVCNSGANITQGRIARCLLPQTVLNTAGQTVATRPVSYDPPAAWAPPA